jgi:hypothetical protein
VEEIEFKGSAKERQHSELRINYIQLGTISLLITENKQEG